MIYCCLPFLRPILEKRLIRILNSIIRTPPKRQTPCCACRHVPKGTASSARPARGPPRGSPTRSESALGGAPLPLWIRLQWHFTIVYRRARASGEEQCDVRSCDSNCERVCCAAAAGSAQGTRMTPKDGAKERTPTAHHRHTQHLQPTHRAAMSSFASDFTVVSDNVTVTEQVRAAGCLRLSWCPHAAATAHAHAACAA